MPLIKIGHLISIMFAVFALVFFLLGIVVGVNHYNQPSRHDRAEKKYFYLCAISLGLFLFFVLITENGNVLNAFCFSVSLMAIMSILLNLQYYIRKKATNFLDKMDQTSAWSAKKEFDKIVEEQLAKQKDDNNKIH